MQTIGRKRGRQGQSLLLPPACVVRMVMALFMAFSAQYMCAVETPQKKASVYADSAYYSNINGNYEKTLQFSDSVRKYLNLRYKQLKPEGKILMARDGDTKTEPAEITWFRDGIDIDYDVILDIRNESAVAALALHDWSLYRYNNRIYTMLFKEKSADKSLAEYCRAMQTSESNKSIAVAMLVLLLILILIAYYFLYYRHRINYSYCMEQVGYINDILLSERSDEEKLSLIKPISTSKYPESLREIVGKVRAALESSVKNSKEKQDIIELAEDERRRAELEDDKLHVSNNVLDNCLSTLKHETMYYPSRIRQIVDEMNDGNTSEEPKRLQAIDELVAYYKELYGILSAQAMRQVNAVKNKCQAVSVNEIMNTKEEGVYAMGDPLMLKHLFDTLQKQNNAPFASVSITPKEGDYIVFRLGMENLKFREFFVPSMQNIPFLICRQIVRENSESTNRRGCGIVAQPSDTGGSIVTVTLAAAKGKQHTNN